MIEVMSDLQGVEVGGLDEVVVEARLAHAPAVFVLAPAGEGDERGLRRRLCGQLSMGPSAVRNQSCAGMRALISPPPTSQSAASGRGVFIKERTLFCSGVATSANP
jgi:hypothetical protein